MPSRRRLLVLTGLLATASATVLPTASADPGDRPTGSMTTLVGADHRRPGIDDFVFVDAWTATADGAHVVYQVDLSDFHQPDIPALWSETAPGATSDPIGPAINRYHNAFHAPMLTADGSELAFLARRNGSGTQLVVQATDTDDPEQYEILSLAPDGSPAEGSVFDADISDDGRFAVFSVEADNFPGSDRGNTQIYLRDRVQGTTELISADASGAPGNHDSRFPQVSADGRYVVFDSRAELEGDNEHRSTRAVLRDRVTGTNLILSRRADGSLASGWGPRISADGSTVVFTAMDDAIADAPSDDDQELYRHDIASGVTTHLLPRPLDDSTRFSRPGDYDVSADGTTVAFVATGGLIGRDDLHSLVYVLDEESSTPLVASLDERGDPASVRALGLIVTEDGDHVVFQGSFHGSDGTSASASRLYRWDRVSCAYGDREDCDGDGLDDVEERAMGTDPARPDTDDDDLDDAAEVALGTDPLRADADADGLNDRIREAVAVRVGVQDPTVRDSDGDGVDDGDEIDRGTDPTDPSSVDSNCDGVDDGIAGPLAGIFGILDRCESR